MFLWILYVKIRPVARNVVWRHRWDAVWGGDCTPLGKIFVFSPSKWYILMHSALWSTFYTNCNCHCDVHDLRVALLSCTCLTVQQKGRSRKICADFSGGFNPHNPALNTGLVNICDKGIRCFPNFLTKAPSFLTLHLIAGTLQLYRDFSVAFIELLWFYILYKVGLRSLFFWCSWLLIILLVRLSVY